MTLAVLKYDEIKENQRSIKIGNYTYNIVLDRNDALWHIEVSSGPLPKALQQHFTTPAHATVAIKNYLDSKGKSQ